VAASIGLTVEDPNDKSVWGIIGTITSSRKLWRKICPNATLITKNPTCTALVSAGRSHLPLSYWTSYGVQRVSQYIGYFVTAENARTEL
jgi:hypothetical protein